QRISLTRPESSASTGISIFIDSRITTVSPSSTCSPTTHSIFQTVPVMWASTSGTDVLLVGCARKIPACVDGARALRGEIAIGGPCPPGTLGAVTDEPAETLPRQEKPEDLTPIRAQVYRDP